MHVESIDTNIGAACLTAKPPVCQTLSSVRIGLMRETFDATNPEHVNLYRLFKQTGRWHDSRAFKIEWPYVSIPATVEAKIVAHALGL